MYVTITASKSLEVRSLVICDRKSVADARKAFVLDAAAIRRLTAMTDNPLIQKGGFVFEAGESHFYLYGQLQIPEDLVTISALIKAKCIDWSDHSHPSAANWQLRVTDLGFQVAKEIRVFQQQKLYADA